MLPSWNTELCNACFLRGKAAEVLFNNLAVKKAFSATGHRDHVPTAPRISILIALGNTNFDSWAKESFEIATKTVYRNGKPIGIPKGKNARAAFVITHLNPQRSWVMRASLARISLHAPSIRSF